jgi:hypothetical protein
LRRQEVFNDCISVRHQCGNLGEILRVFQVSDDVSSMAIDGQVVRGIVTVGGWRECAHWITVWPFNFDDVGSEVSSNHRAERSGQNATEIKDTYSF